MTTQLRATLLSLVVLLGAGCAQPRIPTLEEFLRDVRTAEYGDYAAREDARVRDEQSFEEMRRHVLRMYEGAVEVHSFLLDGHVVDCITVETQPSIRLLGLGSLVREPPRTTRAVEGAGPAPVPGSRRNAESILRLGLADSLGNEIRCPEGTVPVTRITLETLVRYETLRHFFSKGQDGTGVFPDTTRTGDNELKPETGSGARRYAFTIQRVTNHGGNSWLNLWNPSLGADGRMSLSQHWYSAVGEAGNQTLEGGWQVLPSKYGTDDAVLFIYWTADDYQSTGCYNLDCAGFVQVNNNWYLGGRWDHYSSPGGTQWGFELQYKHYRDNWWLFLKGPGSYEAVGYYPDDVYDGGPMGTAAEDILYGGETATDGRWPEMGSGQFADQGWQRAAFQNTIFYIPRNEDDGVGVWADLTAQEPSPSCYTLDLVPASGGGSWGTYFFFGGPGGDPC
jgi:hypothetical protein